MTVFTRTTLRNALGILHDGAEVPPTASVGASPPRPLGVARVPACASGWRDPVQALKSALIPLFWSVLLVAAAAGGGCASSTYRPRVVLSGITPIEETVHAVMGQTLVIPVLLGPEVSPSEPLAVTLDDGRIFAAEVYWISAQPSPMRVSRWLPDPGVWRATPATAGSQPTGAGFWALVIALPIDAVGQGFWLDRRRWPINWIDHAGYSPPIKSPIDPATIASDRFRLLAEPEAQNPMLRVRARLFAGHLGAIGVPGRAPVGPTINQTIDPFEDPVIEALAIQQQARWAAAINALHAHNPALAARLAGALCRTVRLNNARVPAWPIDATELAELLADLLNPRMSPQRRTRLITGWIDAQPAVIAWIADDAGSSDALSGQVVATVAAANVSGETLLVSLSLSGTAIDLQRIEPGEEVLSLLACPTPSEHDGPIAAYVRVQSQEWSSPIRADLIPVVPPGIAMSPMYVDRTLAQWRQGGAGVARQTHEVGGAAALLMRTTYADPSSETTTETWAIYAECITGDGPKEGYVRLWIGPSNAPLAVLTVFADGRVEEERVRRTGATSVKAKVSVARRDDRWSCLIPLPEGSINAQGVVRIGIEHVASDGIRSAWPRPMFPWQTEPARAAFDTRAWGSLSIFGGR